MSDANERANGRVSGPVLQSVFLAVFDHSAPNRFRADVTTYGARIHADDGVFAPMSIAFVRTSAAVIYDGSVDFGEEEFGVKWHSHVAGL